MKKLMIAAAAVATCFAVNAASMAWSALDGNAVIPDSDGEFLDCNGYYSFFMIDSATGTTATPYTLVNAIAAAQEGDFSFVQYNINESGAGDEVIGGYPGSSGADVFTDGATSDFGVYVAILDASDPSKATMAYFTDVVTGSFGVMGDVTETSDGNGWGMPVFDFATTASSANWYGPSEPTPTPEPTSGLMLLVGLAGLALRRKQA